MGVISRSLITAVAIQLSCQAFKVIFYSIRNRRFEGMYFFSAGGMPSAHSAFVAALAVSVGMSSGFASDLFALAFVFAAVTVYDTIRVRGAVQRHSVLLGQLSKLLPQGKRPPLPKDIGHTNVEILVGILAGGIIAFLAALL